MSTKTTTAKPKTKTATKPEREPTPLPPSVFGLLNRHQVCEALGRISLRKLDELIAAGEFPRANKQIGRSPRWSVEFVNQYVHDLPGPVASTSPTRFRPAAGEA